MLHSLLLPVLVTCVVIVSPIMVWTTRLVEFLPVSLTASVHVIMCLAIVSPSMVWTPSLVEFLPVSLTASAHVIMCSHVLLTVPMGGRVSVHVQHMRVRISEQDAAESLVAPCSSFGSPSKACSILCAWVLGCMCAHA